MPNASIFALDFNLNLVGAGIKLRQSCRGFHVGRGRERFIA